MSPRGRDDKRGPKESMMDFYVRMRMQADPAIDQGDVRAFVHLKTTV